MILFDIANLEKELKELEEKTLEENFWNNQKDSKVILNRIKSIKSKCIKFNKEQKEVEELLK